MTDLDAIDERWVFYGSLAHTATHLYVYMLSDLPTLGFCGNNKFLLFCYSVWITPCITNFVESFVEIFWQQQETMVILLL